MVLEGIGAVGELGNQRPHLTARAAGDLLHRRRDDVVAEIVEQIVQPRGAEVERAELGVEVAVIAPGQPGVGEQDVDDVLVDRAAIGELDRRDTHPFLHDVGRRRVVVPRHVAADIEPMADRGEVAEQIPVAEDRLDQLDVVEMGGADIGVVEQVDVAVLRPAIGVGALDRGLGGVAHRADEDRQPLLAHRHGLAVDVIDAVAAVPGLGDHRAEGGAKQRRVHLVDELFQPAADDGEGDGIEIGGGHAIPERRRCNENR